jgi:ammonium transporter family
MIGAGNDWRTDAVSRGKPSVLGIASGAVAGLVAITPASGFVGPTSGVVIGIAAGVVCFIAATSLKHALVYDDSLDAFGVHCIGGIVGALLTGVFASKEIGGVDGSVLTQLKGVATTGKCRVTRDGLNCALEQQQRLSAAASVVEEGHRKQILRPARPERFRHLSGYATTPLASLQRRIRCLGTTIFPSSLQFTPSACCRSAGLRNTPRN